MLASGHACGGFFSVQITDVGRPTSNVGSITSWGGLWTKCKGESKLSNSMDALVAPFLIPNAKCPVLSGFRCYDFHNMMGCELKSTLSPIICFCWSILSQKLERKLYQDIFLNILYNLHCNVFGGRNSRKRINRGIWLFEVVTNVLVKIKQCCGTD